MVSFDKEAYIVEQMRSRVHDRNLNCIVCAVGPTGGGKSWSMLSIAEKLDPTFTVDHLVFSPEDFLDIINSGLPPESVIFWDEAGLGISNRDWQTFLNKSVGWVLQSFRFQRYYLFLTVPDHHFIDTQARALFHWLFECLGAKMGPNVVVAKAYTVQHSARFDETYMAYPRVRLEGRGEVIMESLEIHKPSEGLIRSYESKRARYMHDFYADIREGYRSTKVTRQLVALYNLHESKKVTMNEIASASGVTQQAVSKWFKDIRKNPVLAQV